MMKRSAPSPNILFNNDVVYEIMTWLPPKSLMRFKAINKFWGAKIAQDSIFIQLHRRRSCARIGGEKLLFLLRPTSVDEHRFISVEKDGRNRITEYARSLYDRFHQVDVSVVDGIVCFYTERSFAISGSLYNLSTHESFSLPKVSNFSQASRRESFFFFGCDSSHSLYKILLISRLSDQINAGFEIYTVGNANHSWRRINSPNAFGCAKCTPLLGRICVNGVIYWLSSCHGRRCFDELKITAFDVSDESFHLISLPPDCDRQMSNVNGVLTLMDSMSFTSGLGYVILWKLEDYKNQVWVDEKILIDINAPKLMAPHLIDTDTIGSGSGEILMIHYLGGKEVLLYYDRAKRMSKVVQLDKLAAADEYLQFKIRGYTYVENIMPLASVSN